MSENEFQETTTHSYGENVKNSFGNIIVGVLLFIGSIMILWTNEGNLANKNQMANYINKTAIPVEAAAIDKSNNNKLISTSGEATTEATLSDGIITLPKTLVLNRKVEMYQWEENQETKTDTKMGGTTTETTTYSYEKVWSEHQIDSTKFKRTSYYNPPFPLKSQRYEAKTGKFGEYKLSDSQFKSFHSLEDYTDLPQNPKYTIYDNCYYNGNAESPKIGDIRITYSYLPSGAQISVIGVQRADNTITPMVSKKGRIYIQYDGLLSQDELLEKFRQGNAFMANLLRIVGFIMMFAGLNMILGPIATLLSFIPFFSQLVSAITGGVVFLISAVLSLTIIAVSWCFYRPLLTIGLLVIVAGLIFLIKALIKNK